MDGDTFNESDCYCSTDRDGYSECNGYGNISKHCF
jgi:hypothetical protein